ncbi:MAG: peptidase M16 [Firmicutes bacterium HGW-Firmicutes-15]|nr:MAG: peptidase M16 [Firmicutes bacterium HGW-Firmicutes-15]
MIDSWSLSNGAKLVVEDIPYLKSAAIGVYIRVGSRNEILSLAGASHFIEHMLFKGTAKRTAREIAESFESIGGQLNAFTSKEHTCVYARTLDEDIYTAMEIVFDMLFCSKMAEKDFDTERNVVIEEINMYEDTPDELIHDVFARKFWEGHPMGFSILGTMDTISNMNRDELFQFYKKYYVPANMVISVAGNVENAKIREFIERTLESQKADLPVFVQEKPLEGTGFINLQPKEVEQMQICLGVPGISYHDEDRYTQNVMNSILGGGMSSRLFQKLREELGLAYSVYSYPSSYSDTGLYSIYIGTGPDKVGQFCAALYEQIDNFIKHGVKAEEITRTQKLMKSSISLGLESVMNRMTRLAKSMLMYGEIVSPEEVIERVYAVKPDMIQEMAHHIFKPELFSLAAIGDKEVLPIVEQEFQKWWGKR